MRNYVMSDPTGANGATPATWEWKRHSVDWLALSERVKKYREANGATDYNDILVAENASGALEDLAHFAHPTAVVAPKKSHLGQEMIATLFGCSRGHSNLVICHAPGTGTAILGILHNSVTINDGKQVPIIFGDDQKAAAEVITLAIHYGILPQDPKVQKTVVIGFQQYRDAKADNPEHAFDNAVAAYAAALVSALTGGTSQEVAQACCGKATHPFSQVVPHAFPEPATTA